MDHASSSLLFLRMELLLVRRNWWIVCGYVRRNFQAYEGVHYQSADSLITYFHSRYVLMLEVDVPSLSVCFIAPGVIGR